MKIKVKQSFGDCEIIGEFESETPIGIFKQVKAKWPERFFELILENEVGQQRRVRLLLKLTEDVTYQELYD